MKPLYDAGRKLVRETLKFALLLLCVTDQDVDQDVELTRLRETIRKISLTGVWGNGAVGSGSPSGGGEALDAILHVQHLVDEIARLRKENAELRGNA